MIKRDKVGVKEITKACNGIIAKDEEGKEKLSHRNKRFIRKL